MHVHVVHVHVHVHVHVCACARVCEFERGQKATLHASSFEHGEKATLHASSISLKVCEGTSGEEVLVLRWEGDNFELPRQP